MRHRSFCRGVALLAVMMAAVSTGFTQTQQKNSPNSMILYPSYCSVDIESWRSYIRDLIVVPVDFHTIQDAIDNAVDNEIVLVEPGTYFENINFKGKAITVKSLYGACCTEINGRFPDDPDYGSVVTFCSGEQMNSRLIGFTLREGCGTINWPSGSSCGGGIYCEDASPYISNNIIMDNTTHLSENNHGVGAGMFFSYSNAMVVNNLIAHCTADNKGGGIACGASNLTLRNITIAYNEATDSGGGIYASSNTTLKMESCIVWENSAALGPDVVLRGGSRLQVSFCDIKGGLEAIEFDPLVSFVYWGNGMISQDPLFMNNPDGDFLLSQIAAGQDQNSPCVNAGKRSSMLFLLNRRWTRTDKVFDRGTVDMGYHYYSKL